MNFLRVPVDSLAELTDEDIRLLQVPTTETPAAAPEPWWEKFKYDRYDWDDPGFIAKNKGPGAYVPVLLTQGYFMMVSPDQLEFMTTHSDGSEKRWHAHLKYDSQGKMVGVYARRHGRTRFDSTRFILAHRELLGIIDDLGLVGDHINGWGLDNRSRKRTIINLGGVHQRVNNHNAQRHKRLDLPQGVVRTGKEDNYRYYGQVCHRFGPKVVTIRSRKYKTVPPALRWYQNYLKRRCRRTMWAHRPETVNFPLFPPLKPEYRRLQTQVESFELEATF